MLHGQAAETSVESVFVPSFASECVEFKAKYSMQADTAHGPWHGIVQDCGLLLNRQLSWCDLSQGTMFCSKHLSQVQLEKWKWE